jgi:2-phosphosulfolactate phosphatase
VGVAAFINHAAAATWALARGRDVLLLCAGERGARSLEDYICAGMLVERLAAADPTASPTSEAERAAGAARPYGKDVARLAQDSSWARHLTSVGRGRDVAACLVLDTRALVPEYRRDVDKIVGGRR